MPDIFTVGAVTAIPIRADSIDQKKITNARGGTVYYKNSSDVTTSSSDGNLTTGQSVTLSATNWVIGSADTILIKEDTPASPAFTDITASDDVTISDTLTVSGTTALTGAVTTTGGIAQATAPHGFANWQPVAATSGSDTTPADGTQFVTSIFIPANKTITNINYLIGSVGGTNVVYGVIYDAAGTNVKNTSLTSGGATVGTAANVQTLALTSTYAAKGPALYYVGISINGNTARLRTVPAHTQSGIFAGSVSQTQGVSPTVAAITPPTTFTADKAPVVYLS